MGMDTKRVIGGAVLLCGGGLLVHAALGPYYELARASGWESWSIPLAVLALGVFVVLVGWRSLVRGIVPATVVDEEDGAPAPESPQDRARAAPVVAPLLPITYSMPINMGIGGRASVVGEEPRTREPRYPE